MRLIEELKVYPPIHNIFSLFQDEKNAVFLDSSLQNKLGNYSIIGLYPYLELSHGEQFTVNGQICNTSFEAFVKEYMKENKDMNDTHLPIVSGAIGYFSYEYGRKKNGVSSRHKEGLEGLDIPDTILCFYDVFIIEDHCKKKLHLIANGHNKEGEKQIQELKDKILLTHNGRSPLNTSAIHVQSNFLKSDYLKAISQMINHIVEGDIYIANMTHQLKICSALKPYDFFEKLRGINPSPFGGYLNYENFQVISSSPERFLCMQDSHVVTRPIKGTRKRGASVAEDELLKKELLGSEKDKSELLMIVDLERNDLNKVCIPGTVKVTDLFSIEEYATVFHLVSGISGNLRKDLTVMDLIEATFPGGSITGTPKHRAMEIIDEVENGGRNIYTGSMGYLTLDGNCDFNIIIRTAVYQNGTYHLGVGGGITCESDLELEYEETMQKAKAILEALHYS